MESKNNMKEREMRPDLLFSLIIARFGQGRLTFGQISTIAGGMAMKSSAVNMVATAGNYGYGAPAIEEVMWRYESKGLLGYVIPKKNDYTPHASGLKYPLAGMVARVWNAKLSGAVDYGVTLTKTGIEFMLDEIDEAEKYVDESLLRYTINLMDEVAYELHGTKHGQGQILLFNYGIKECDKLMTDALIAKERLYKDLPKVNRNDLYAWCKIEKQLPMEFKLAQGAEIAGEEMKIGKEKKMDAGISGIITDLYEKARNFLAGSQPAQSYVHS